MSTVVVLKTRPETVIQDYKTLLERVEYEKILREKEVLLKLNLSWSLYFPSCSTQPWQLDGVLKVLAKDYTVLPVENKTVVTDPFTGSRKNKWAGVFEQYGLTFQSLTDVRWVRYKSNQKTPALDEIFPEGFEIPEMFKGKQIVHLPTVKCVHPETELFLGDGQLVKIKDCVDEVHSCNAVTITADSDEVATVHHHVLSLSDRGRLDTEPAHQFWKTPSPETVLRVRTKTGRTVTVSTSHPFLTPGGWKMAKDLTCGDRIAVPRRIPAGGATQELPKLRELDFLNPEINKASINIPKKTSEPFWRWVGYFTAGGHTQKEESTTRFWWYGEDPEVRRDYRDVTKALFTIEVKRRGKNYYFDSMYLEDFFKKAGILFPVTASQKTVPQLLFTCPAHEIAAFLQGYLDRAATVADDGLHVVTESADLAKRIQLLFLMLGVVSLKRDGQYDSDATMGEECEQYEVAVYGEDLSTMSRCISFCSEKKADAMQKVIERWQKKREPSDWDTIPLDVSVIKRVGEGLGLSQESCNSYCAPAGDRDCTLPRHKDVRDLVCVFESLDTAGTFKKEIDYMKFLSSEDIAWDYIACVEEIACDVPWLYDVTVTTTSNFVGDGFILHNTHGHTTTTGAMKNAFGGLLKEHRHHSHKLIHQVLVDLLKIQKEIHPSILAVVDGTVCGDGAGPRTMRPHCKGLILASDDQVAIDAVSATIMGFDPLSIQYISLAHEEGLGVGDIDDITIVGEDISRINFGFQSKKSPVIFWDQMFRQKKLRFLENLIFHTRLFRIPVMLSKGYHDYLWYPLVGRYRINQFSKTEWGTLFEKY
jgi:intein/homing endonuclease/uncharacterized protein (DUF362 family)